MLLFLFTALFSTTYAFQPAEDMPCDSPSVVFTSPSVGQTNVPLNVQPIVGMTIDNCDAPTYYEVSLREGDAIIHTVQSIGKQT